VNFLSRTKRIYNSYKKYGRFLPKSAWGTWVYVGGIRQREPMKPYNLEFEKNPKKGYNTNYLRRWHPYAVWCMGSCQSCRLVNPKYLDKRKKHTRKHKEMKFRNVMRYQKITSTCG
jgi:hypothetical protein